MSVTGPGTPDDKARVLSTQRKRWDFIRRLYDQHQQVPAGQHQADSADDVGRAVGLDDDAEIQRIYMYLSDRGLIKLIAQGPLVAITRAGIDAVERALAVPDEATVHFAPINMLNVVGGIHGSQIQQGVHSSSQTQSVDWQGLRTLLPDLRNALQGLSGNDGAIATAHVETLEAQSKSPAPSPRIVRESLFSLRSILENAGGEVVGQAIYFWLKSQGWL